MNHIGVRVGERVTLFRNANEPLNSASDSPHSIADECITVLHDRLQKYEALIKNLAWYAFIDGHHRLCDKYGPENETDDHCICTCGFEEFLEISDSVPVSYDVDMEE